MNEYTYTSFLTQLFDCDPWREIVPALILIVDSDVIFD